MECYKDPEQFDVNSEKCQNCDKAIDCSNFYFKFLNNQINTLVEEITKII